MATRLSAPAYRCDVCDNTFSRKEHLQRHQVTHGLSRSFQCSQCMQIFNRSDILRRHERTHRVSERDAGPESPTASVGRRSRVSAACDACAVAKLRCNGVIPCDRCKRKSLICTLDRPHGAIRRRGYNQQPPTPISSSGPSRIPNHIGLPGNITQSYSAEGETNDQRSTLDLDDLLPHPSQDLNTRSELNDNLVTTTPDRRQTTIGQNTILEATNAPLHTATDLSLGDSGNGEPFSTWPDFPLSFFAASPRDSSDLPPFLWEPQVDHLLEQGLHEEQPVIEESTHPQPKPHEPAAEASNPYGNYPFMYRFQRGLSLKVHHICDFMQNRRCWDDISSLYETHNRRYQIPAHDLTLIRDIVLARVHGILYSTFGRQHLRSVPHSFPPAHIVGYLLSTGRLHVSEAYPILHPAIFDELVKISPQDTHSDAGLLLATIMALGCLLTPVPEARSFGIQLVYIIRININESAARDESYLMDKWVITSWLLITVFSAWSGIKRHSEIAEAFHGIFTAFFSRRGYYKIPSTNICPQTERSHSAWRKWIDQERDRRFAQVWYLMEQEISFFYCIPSTIYFGKLCGPLPSSNALFFAINEHEWANATTEQQFSGGEVTAGMGVDAPSLSSLYYAFCRPNFLHLNLCPTPLQLRLLLCPLQAQVSQYAQTNRFIPRDSRFSGAGSGLLHFHSSSLMQQEELASLIDKWYLLQKKVFKSPLDSQDAIHCALMHHLIYVELMICFDDVQLIIGKEGYEAGKALLPALRQWSQSQIALKAIAHAGQALKILQSIIHLEVQPLWWPVALSRVALVIKCYVLGVYFSTGSGAGMDESLVCGALLISLNDPRGDDGMHGRILHPGEGIPCVTDQKGKLVPIHQVDDLLDVFLDTIASCRVSVNPLCDAVARFLEDIKRCGVPYTRDMAGPF